MAHAKAMRETSTCVKHTVCYLPVEIDNFTVEIANVQLPPGLRPVQLTVNWQIFLDAVREALWCYEPAKEHTYSVRRFDLTEEEYQKTHLN